MSNSNKFILQNPEISKSAFSKCTNNYNCMCNICATEDNIILMLKQREQFEWFGQKKSIESKKLIKQLSTDFPQVKNQKSSRKNQSKNIANFNNHVNSESSYQNSYVRKNGNKSEIFLPENNLNSEKLNICQMKSMYKDNFQQKSIQIEVQKPIKRLQEKIDLPFIGKSNYKENFSLLNLAPRQQIIIPKNSIKLIEVDAKLDCKDSTVDSFQTQQKNKRFYRPPSPIKHKGHMMISKSMLSAYQTLYQNNFKGKEGYCGQRIINEPNQQFIRRSKFGSSGKARWIKHKIINHSTQKSLSLYK